MQRTLSPRKNPICLPGVNIQEVSDETVAPDFVGSGQNSPLSARSQLMNIHVIHKIIGFIIINPVEGGPFLLTKYSFLFVIYSE
jgi:hypothetical protein